MIDGDVLRCCYFSDVIVHGSALYDGDVMLSLGVMRLSAIMLIVLFDGDMLLRFDALQHCGTALSDGDVT